MTQYESDIVMDMLGTCERPAGCVRSGTALGTVTGEHKPEPDGGASENSVYGSCEEAGVCGGAEGAGKLGRRTGFPEGDGPVRAGRGRRRYSV